MSNDHWDKAANNSVSGGSWSPDVPDAPPLPDADMEELAQKLILENILRNKDAYTSEEWAAGRDERVQGFRDGVADDVTAKDAGEYALFFDDSGSAIEAERQNAAADAKREEGEGGGDESPYERRLAISDEFSRRAVEAVPDWGADDITDEATKRWDENQRKWTDWLDTDVEPEWADDLFKTPRQKQAAADKAEADAQGISIYDLRKNRHDAEKEKEEGEEGGSENPEKPEPKKPQEPEKPEPEKPKPETETEATPEAASGPDDTASLQTIVELLTAIAADTAAIKDSLSSNGEEGYHGY
ncbi:hypothetical protein N9878_01245 [bacterium]|nr:hypothetical protein [bacterium]